MTIETGTTWFGGFEPEPRGRGTWGLLFSCMATFGFCVWTVIHPNILFGVTRNRQRLGHKAVLMVMSIIFPEFIVVAAFGEWCDALKLHKEWKRLVPQHPNHLGMQGAFFIVMGGFVFDIDATEDITASNASPPGRTKATLTPAGFLEYLREERINKNTFDKAAILDKSKTSNIAKLLSGSQALWLFMSCFVRWSASLPLSLLEIHVLIQVACTFFVVFFWWSKPRDVNEPLTITLEPTNTDDGASHTYRGQPPQSDILAHHRPYITERPSPCHLVRRIL